jgi:uncharacterized protein YkwD
MIPFVITVAILFIIYLIYNGNSRYKKNEDIDSIYKIEQWFLTDTSLEYQIHTIINKKREENNLHPLIIDNRTQEIAIQRCGEMIFDKKVSHDAFGKHISKLTAIGADQVGENVAYGYVTAQGVCNGWFKSPGHLKNILNSHYDWCGISVAQDPITKKNYFCQFFGGDNEIN